ncbi:hypothetical protein ZWY2020_014589, partial [Hordeum vulgare]
NFWWTAIRETNSKMILCLGAWKDITNSKSVGGLGIRNLKAINESLILATAQRLAKHPSSHLCCVLQAKYFPTTSIWKATNNPPKSAFSSSILKMLPKLKEHAFYQLTQGNISIWSMPWCNLWNSIHDFLIPQPSCFIYPSLVKDLWQPGQRQWNHQFSFSIFKQPLATQNVNIDIFDDDYADILCWPLSPIGIFSSKAAYKLCLQDIHTNPRTDPMDVPLELK